MARGLSIVPDHVEELSVAREAASVLDPATLYRILLAAAREGNTQYRVHGATESVAALSSSSFELAVPEGYVSVIMAPVGVDASRYDPLVRVHVRVDNQLVTPDGYAVMRPTEIPLGQYYRQREVLALEAVNDTAEDVLVSYHVEVLLLQKTFHDRVWKPVIERAMETVMDTASRMRGD